MILPVFAKKDHVEMSFTVEYDLEKRPKQIFPDGREEYQEDAGRWALFQQAEEVGFLFNCLIRMSAAAHI